MNDEWTPEPSRAGWRGVSLSNRHPLFRNEEARMLPLTRLLRSMAMLSLLLWILCFVYIAIDLSQGHGFPLIRKFFPFEDITIYQSRFKLFHSNAFYLLPHRRPGSPVAFAYPPAAALVYAVFYGFNSPTNLYLVLLVLWVAVVAGGAWLTLRRFLPSSALVARYIVCLSAFCFPLLFLAERANIELLVWIAITAAVWLYLRGQQLAAAVLIGCAASVKIYPILLLGLFVSARRIDWRLVASGVFAAIITTVLALVYAGPTFGSALSGFVAGVSKFNEQHAELPRRSEAVFDHSLFSPVKIAYLGTHAATLQWTKTYFVLAGVGALLVFWLRVHRMPFLNRLAFLSTAMILLPPVSYEYTVVHLYLSLLLLLLFATLQLRSSVPPETTGLPAIACLLVAMLPLGLLQGGNFLYAGLVQLIALLCFAFFAARRPWDLPSNLQVG